MDLKRIGNGAHYSEVIDYNGILYLSWQKMTLIRSIFSL